MRKEESIWILVALLTVFLLADCSRSRGELITQTELVRRTQELMDAVALGDRRPFERYFAADTMFFDEKGRNMDKKTLVADQSPLPPGYSGTIKVVNARSRILDDTAILSYDLDETEVIFGQVEKARYHETDTWMRQSGNWQIVAGQMLRYYEDPAPGHPDLKREPDYVGNYELTPGKTMAVSLDRTNLYSQEAGKSKELLIPEAGDIFFRKGIEGRRVFRRDDHGKVDALIIRRNNEDVVWKKIR